MLLVMIMLATATTVINGTSAVSEPKVSYSTADYFTYYLCQVKGVTGGDTVFVRCVCVCVCVQRTGQSDQFKMVKATDFKFDVHVYGDSPDMIP